jgi:hypothetical protein
MLMCACVCAFLLHRESLDMILGDKPLISEVVLSHYTLRNVLSKESQLREVQKEMISWNLDDPGWV